VLDLGKTVDLPVTMQLSSMKETVTCRAVADGRREADRHGDQRHADELSNIPTSRDPFALIALGARRASSIASTSAERDRTAIQFRVEGHAPARCDSGRSTASPSPT
jgi:hypothetical protein